MENDILDSLNDLGYEGPLTEEVAFAKALDGGPKSLEFTKLIHILAEELKTLCNLEETVNMINDADESSSFLLELSSFLKELGCPYKCLVTGHMSSRLQSKEDCLLLLDYLVSELMSARMVQVDRPKDKQGSGMEIVMQETPTAKDLKEILMSLKFNKPPPNITVELLFSKLEAKLKDTIQKEGDKLVGKPLYNKALTDKDWKNLETAYTEMYEEYRLRRETLITRLECTIQSFEWSDRLKSKKDTIQSVYRPCRNSLTVKPAVKMADFLAARTTLLQVEKTSSASVRKNTQSDVNKVIIGRVPDRGGRPNEQQPPPPEMPSWQQRSAPQKKPEVRKRGPQLSWYYNEMLRSSENKERKTENKERITENNECVYVRTENGSNNNLNTSTPKNQKRFITYTLNPEASFQCNQELNKSQNIDTKGKKMQTNQSKEEEKSSELSNESSDDIIPIEDENEGGGGRGGMGGGGMGRGGGEGGRGGRGGGGRGGGGRVQGGYSQATGQDHGRPQSSPAPFNQNRNYQTYEVPPGGYNNYQNNGNHDRYDNRQDTRGYNQGHGGDNNYQRQNSYDSAGSYNQGYNQGGGGGGYKTYQQGQSQSQGQGYQQNRYQHEHDDRRGRGGYRGRR